MAMLLDFKAWVCLLLKVNINTHQSLFDKLTIKWLHFVLVLISINDALCGNVCDNAQRLNSFFFGEGLFN